MRGQAMEREIREQPEVLARNAADYLEFASEFGQGRSFDLVVLAARGSSDNAALFARYLFEIHLGVPVTLAAPSVVTRYNGKLRYPKSLVVGISQSGAAPDVSEFMAAARAAGHETLAVTNTAGSRLSTEAEGTLLLNAGQETAVAATKTYTASLLAMYQLVRGLGGDLPEPVLPDEDVLSSSHDAAEEALGAILRAHLVFALGRGYQFSTGYETALKLIECALLTCKPYSTADFEHGPKALARHGTAAIAYGPVRAALEEAGCELVTAPHLGDEPWRPMQSILFGQWISLLAARARGLDPDQPEGLSKVTLTR